MGRDAPCPRARTGRGRPGGSRGATPVGQAVAVAASAAAGHLHPTTRAGNAGNGHHASAATGERRRALGRHPSPPRPRRRVDSSFGTPFLDTPWVPPQTRRQAWFWILFALIGFLVGQIAAVIFAAIGGAIAGDTSAQLQAIASAQVPPEWYVVITLLGLWIGFIGAPWLASFFQGTRHFLRDLGIRMKWIDLIGIPIGLAGQFLVVLMYAPFQHEIHDFNGPTNKLTGGAHGGGFAVIAIAVIVFAPAMEELFFRGLLLKGLVRAFAPNGASGRLRAATVVLAVIVDGLLFGLAHGEWVQLAGLAVFGMILATISYRTGRLGMNFLAHATFNSVAILALVVQGNAVIH